MLKVKTLGWVTSFCLVWQLAPSDAFTLPFLPGSKVVTPFVPVSVGTPYVLYQSSIDDIDDPIPRPPSKVHDPFGPYEDPRTVPVEDLEEIDPEDVPELSTDPDHPDNYPFPDQPWRSGMTNGCEDPIDSPWRKKAETVIREAVERVGGTLIDITWFLTAVVIHLDDQQFGSVRGDPIQPGAPVIEVEYRETQAPEFRYPNETEPVEVDADETPLIPWKYQPSEDQQYRELKLKRENGYDTDAPWESLPIPAQRIIYLQRQMDRFSQVTGRAFGTGRMDIETEHGRELDAKNSTHLFDGFDDTKVELDDDILRMSTRRYDTTNMTLAQVKELANNTEEYDLPSDDMNYHIRRSLVLAKEDEPPEEPTSEDSGEVVQDKDDELVDHNEDYPLGYDQSYDPNYVSEEDRERFNIVDFDPEEDEANYVEPEAPEDIDADSFNAIGRSVIEALQEVEEELEILERHEVMLTGPPMPGIIETQKQFDENRGKHVEIFTVDPWESNRTIRGHLVARTSMDVLIFAKGNEVTVPHNFINYVQLGDGVSESDP
eukprot:Nitzschia sp. Nitz4//scaffold36_size144017//73033//74667//NITZ4_003095-RA/size144017-processed-gene-0.268-mRNA-1//-1//CDS//3329549483//4465//frame0